MTQCTLCNNCIYKEFPPEIDSYFGFEKGSYWIYKNTTNGALDSLYVNSYFKTIGSSKEVCTDAAIDQGITSSNLGESNLGNVFYLNSADMTLAGYDFASNQINVKETSTVTVLNKRYENSLVLNNCCLSNNCQNSVLEGRCRNISQAPIVISKLIFAPNVGIVKWEVNKHPIYGKTTFELVRYKIVKP